jgi:hypothetical protein
MFLFMTPKYHRKSRVDNKNNQEQSLKITDKTESQQTITVLDS